MITQNLLIFIIIFEISLINYCKSTKWWIENPEFNKPENWENNKIPCSRDKIIFPDKFSSIIYTPINLKTNGIIFPSDGTILFHSNSNITFIDNNDNNNIIKNEKCENINNLAKMKNIKTRNWFNPNNWKELPGTEQNLATPHINRIPCSDEKVFIGLDGALSIDLDYVDELYIGGLYMGNKNLTDEDFTSFLKTDFGQTMFKNGENTVVKYSNEPICGCHRIENIIEYQWKVCKYAKNTCEIPKCVNPIVPTGHCCQVCGSSLKLYVDCNNFNMNTFERQLNKALKNEEELWSEVYIDYRMVKDGGEEFLQLVILDNDIYDEKSIKLMNILKETLFKINYDSTKYRLIYHMSGVPYLPGQSSSGWIFMLSSLLGVLIFFAIIFAYYIPEKPPISFPSWLIPNRYRVFTSPFVFARFDNNQPDVEITTAVNITGTGSAHITEEINTNNDAAVNAASQQQGTTSFNNPMFDENPEKQTTQERSGGPLESEFSEIVLDVENDK